MSKFHSINNEDNATFGQNCFFKFKGKDIVIKEYIGYKKVSILNPLLFCVVKITLSTIQI